MNTPAHGTDNALLRQALSGLHREAWAWALNCCDRNRPLGREVQQSDYAGPDSYGNPTPRWTNFSWNPIGAGDSQGNPATVVTYANDRTTIYTRTLPLQ